METCGFTGVGDFLPTSPHLWRAVAADGGGAGTGARARDVAVLAVAAGPRWVPSRAIARWWRRLLWWWLWRRRLLRGWLLLGSPVVAASVVGVVVIPVAVTPAVLVVATTSTAVESCVGETRREAYHSQAAILVTAAAPAWPGTAEELSREQSTLLGFPDPWACSLVQPW